MDTTIQVVMPEMGDSVAEGTILEWHKAEGTPSRPTRRSSRSRPTRSTPRSPRPPPAPSREILAAEGETVAVGRSSRAWPSMAPGAERRRGPPRGRRAGRAAAGARRASGRPRRPRRAGRGRRRARLARRAPRRRRARRRARRGRRAAGPGGRIMKDDVLAAAQRRPRAGARHARRPAGAQPLKGGAAPLARYMDESRSIPTATSFRTLTVTTLDARRKQLKAAGLKVSFTHLIAYAIARRGRRDAGDGTPLRRDRRQAAPRRRRRREPRARRRRREEGRLAHADGAGHPRRRARSTSRPSSPPTTRSSRRRARTR